MKVGANLKFTIKSIFSNSDMTLSKTNEDIYIPKAICPDCTVTKQNKAWWNLFTLIGPEPEEIIYVQNYTVNDLNIFNTI